MAQFSIITDSGCDMPYEFMNTHNIKAIDLNVRFNDDNEDYYCSDRTYKEFYDLMRAGKVAKTSSASIDAFTKMFEAELKNGRDVLYLGFSSGLTSMVNNARIAVEDLKEEYPDRKIIIFDSLSASSGQGMILYYAIKKMESGADIEEVNRYVNDLRLRICHWFTVDDLVYLKRGGRLDPKAAFVGNVLNIKPVMHMDDEGHLINVTKARGRKAAIKMLADKYFELAEDPEHGMYFISHSDCIEDAMMLDSFISGKNGVHAEIISDIGPVIGAHIGPGTLGFYFVGRER